MIVNKKFKTEPILVHAPGIKINRLKVWEKVLNWSKNIQANYQKPEDLEIITYNNKNNQSINNKKLGNFEESLIRCGIKEFTVLGKQVVNWKNKIKISLLKNHIKNCNKKYILSSDSTDVLLINNIESMIEKFLKMKCDMLFNAETLVWPTDLHKNILEFEEKTCIEGSKYLNAGLWIGKTEYVKKLLASNAKIIWTKKHPNSEQIYWKHQYFYNYPNIKIDNKCEIFQGLNGCEEITIDGQACFSSKNNPIYI